MPQPTQCRVCRHPERQEIDRLLLTPGGPTLTEVAQTYGVSLSAVSRHRSQHLSESLRRALERGASGSPASALAEIRGIVERLRKGWATVERIMDDAVQAQDGELALKAAGKFALLGREFRRTIELLGSATGELRETEGPRATMVIVVPALAPVGSPADLAARLPAESLPAPQAAPQAAESLQDGALEAEWEDVPPGGPPSAPGETPSAPSFE